MQLLAHHCGQLPWLDAVSRRFVLTKANEALAAVANREVVKALIVRCAINGVGTTAVSGASR